MKMLKTGPLLLVLAAGGASAPVLADCCSGWLSCAATVVTYGVSCEVQTIIDTINALYTEVTNFGNDLTGITSAKEQGARQYVTDTINNMQSQSQQSAADLAAAVSQAKLLYQEETVILPMKSATVNTQNLQANSPTTLSGSTSSGGGAPASMTMQRIQGAAATTVAPTDPAAPSGNQLQQKSTINVTSAAQGPTLDTTRPPRHLRGCLFAGRQAAHRAAKYRRSGPVQGQPVHRTGPRQRGPRRCCGGYPRGGSEFTGHCHPLPDESDAQPSPGSV